MRKTFFPDFPTSPYFLDFSKMVAKSKDHLSYFIKPFVYLLKYFVTDIH